MKPRWTSVESVLYGPVEQLLIEVVCRDMLVKLLADHTRNYIEVVKVNFKHQFYEKTENTTPINQVKNIIRSDGL